MSYSKRKLVTSYFKNYKKIKLGNTHYIKDKDNKCIIREEKSGTAFITSTILNYIDYLLYNYKMNCFCVIEIKAREYRKTDYGQIKIYMNYVDEHLKTVTQNNTIGIIITKSVNNFEEGSPRWADNTLLV